MTDDEIKFRGQFAEALFLDAVKKSDGLGTVSKAEREKIFDVILDIGYEAADAALRARDRHLSQVSTGESK